jgi:phage recombination protein Bet
MNSITPIRPGANYTAEQMRLVHRTVAKDCDNDEFDLFMTIARHTGLDPFRKQIHALVFNKDRRDKRRMVTIVGIDGMRAIAARSGRYRPDEKEPVYTTIQT